MFNLPELIAALTFFGAFVVCPLVYMLMKHQKAIAEVMHRGQPNELMARLDSIERELRELKTAQYSKIISEDDQRELSKRIG